MGLVDTEIGFYYSGGASNSTPANSIGGAKGTKLTENQRMGTDFNAIFPEVLGTDAARGITDYRGIYIENDDTEDTTWTTIRGWVTGTIGDDDVTMNLQAHGASTVGNTGTKNQSLVSLTAVDRTSATAVQAQTAPASIAFPGTTPASFATGIRIPDLGRNDYCGIWLRRVVAASAGANSGGITKTWRFQGTANA